MKDFRADQKEHDPRVEIVRKCSPLFSDCVTIVSGNIPRMSRKCPDVFHNSCRKLPENVQEMSRNVRGCQFLEIQKNFHEFI